MTCIVALVEDSIVYVGGDSAGASGWDIATRADEKIFRNGDALWGYTSSFRMGQLLRYSFTFPPHPEDVSLGRFMCTTFINAVRDCLKAGGYARKTSEQEEGGIFIVGYRRRIFRVDSDYQVAEMVHNFDAVGCGAPIALGALYATRQVSLSPRQRVHDALEAAAEFSNGVRGPFHIETLGGPEAAS